MVYKFCTLDDVKPLAKIGKDWNGFHDLIQSKIIPLATAQVQNFCRRQFVKGVYTEYFPTQEVSNSYSKFWLRELNIAASPPLTFRIDYNWPDWTTIDPQLSNTYRVDLANGVVTFLGYTREHAESVQIVYTGGFDISPADNSLVLVPDNLRLGTAMQAAFLLDRVLDSATGQEEKRIGQRLAVKLAGSSLTGVIPEVAAMIAQYRSLLTGKLSHGAPTYI